MKHTASQKQIINKIEVERENSSNVTCTQHKITKKQFISIAEWLTETFNSFQANVNNEEVIITIGI
jgi:CRISPR/Cas system-associated protein endoribonuclease Cas2